MRSYEKAGNSCWKASCSTIELHPLYYFISNGYRTSSLSIVSV